MEGEYIILLFEVENCVGTLAVTDVEFFPVVGIPGSPVAFTEDMTLGWPNLLVNKTDLGPDTRRVVIEQQQLGSMRVCEIEFFNSEGALLTDVTFQSTSVTFVPPKQICGCESWCASNTSPWEVKCTKSMTGTGLLCCGCDMCQSQAELTYSYLNNGDTTSNACFLAGDATLQNSITADIILPKGESLAQIKVHNYPYIDSSTTDDNQVETSSNIFDAQITVDGTSWGTLSPKDTEYSRQYLSGDFFSGEPSVFTVPYSTYCPEGWFNGDVDSKRYCFNYPYGVDNGEPSSDQRQPYFPEGSGQMCSLKNRIPDPEDGSITYGDIVVNEENPIENIPACSYSTNMCPLDHKLITEIVEESLVVESEGWKVSKCRQEDDHTLTSCYEWALKAGEALGWENIYFSYKPSNQWCLIDYMVESDGLQATCESGGTKPGNEVTQIASAGHSTAASGYTTYNLIASQLNVNYTYTCADSSDLESADLCNSAELFDFEHDPHKHWNPTASTPCNFDTTTQEIWTISDPGSRRLTSSSYGGYEWEWFQCKTMVNVGIPRENVEQLSFAVTFSLTPTDQSGGFQDIANRYDEPLRSDTGRRLETIAFTKRKMSIVNDENGIIQREVEEAIAPQNHPYQIRVVRRSTMVHEQSMRSSEWNMTLVILIITTLILSMSVLLILSILFWKR